MNDDQLLRLLDETRKEVEKAESKASILLAGGSLGIGTIVSVLLSGDVSYEEFSVATKVLFTTSAGLMLAGLVLLGFALVPRLDVNPAHASMLGYFGHVSATGSMDEFERLADGPSDERSRLKNQIWTLSVVTTRKYRFIAAAFQCFGSAVVIGVLAYLVNVTGI